MSDMVVGPDQIWWAATKISTITCWPSRWPRTAAEAIGKPSGRVGQWDRFDDFQSRSTYGHRQTGHARSICDKRKSRSLHRPWDSWPASRSGMSLLLTA